MAALTPELQAIYDDAVARNLSHQQLGALHGIPGKDVEAFIAGSGLAALRTDETPEEVHAFAVENNLSAAAVADAYGTSEQVVNDYTAANKLPQLTGQTTTPAPTPTPGAGGPGGQFSPPPPLALPDPYVAPSPPEISTYTEGAPVPGTPLLSRAREAATPIPEGTAVGAPVAEAPTTVGDPALAGFQGIQVDETPTPIARAGETAVGPAVAETPAFTAPAPQQTGQGSVFEAPTAAERTRSYAENLAYFTSQENPLTALAKQRGLNIAEERGMGSGSFAARAAEGAVLDYAAPIVREAEQVAAQERLQSQQLTAQSEIQARQRQLDEALQSTQFTFQSGEAATDRQMSRDFETTRTNLAELMQERDIVARSGDQARARQLERDIASDQNKLTALMQSSDQGFQAGESAAQRQVVRDLEDQRTRLTELTQQRELAVQSGDRAAQRQLDADITAAQIQLAESQQIRELSSLEYRASQNLNAQERMQASELTVRQMMQRDGFSAEETMQLRDLSYREEAERLTRLQRTLEQQRNLAFQRDDTEAQRDLQRELTEAAKNLQMATQDRDIEFQTVQREMDRRLQGQLQEIDIDYRKWLQDATSGHEALLESNRNAAILLSSYQDQLGVILANPDTTRDQKQSSIDALKNAVKGSLNVLDSVSGADLSQFLPESTSSPVTDFGGGGLNETAGFPGAFR